MKTQKLLRLVGFAALVLVALGAAGYALGGRDEGAPSLTGVTDEPAVGSDGDVMSQVDKALGRPSSGTQVAPVEKGAAIAPAPAGGGEKAQRNAGASTAGAGADSAAPLASLADRKIVQTASLRLQVKEVGASFEEVGRIATAAGGFVASSSLTYQGDPSTLRQGSGQAPSTGSGQVQIASMTIRVPAARYQEVLGELRALGVKVDAETSNASDVTEEYSDLAARLRNLEAAEAQLLTLLGRAGTISDILTVQDRLNAVRGQIEQVKGRMNLLDKLSDLATVTVHLRPVIAVAKVDTGGTDLGAEVSEAWDASIEFLGGIAAVVLTGVVFLWWLPLVGVPGALIGRRFVHSRPQPIEAVD